jgi:phage gpG-like protein
MLVYKDTDLGWKDLQKRIKQFKKAVIKVGIQAGSGRSQDGVRVVDYAAWNEFGTKSIGGNIPERSFIRSTAAAKNNWNKEIDKAYINVIDNKYSPLGAIGIVGVQAVDDIKATITAGVEPKNAPATVEKKGSTKTLIDTGLLRNSIRWQYDEGT